MFFDKRCFDGRHSLLQEKRLVVHGFKGHEAAFVLAFGQRRGRFVHDACATGRGRHHVEHNLGTLTQILQGVPWPLVLVD